VPTMFAATRCHSTKGKSMLRTRHGWIAGDLVSFMLGDRRICGKVIELRRRADNEPFLLVECTGGGRIGFRSYPDESWKLGTGTHLLGCRCCAQEFWSDEFSEVLCPACDRQTQATCEAAAAEDSHLRLYGRGRRHIG
jgi:hypothetical protein